MKLPSKLYRYRPLNDERLLERELTALRDSYLFAPPFSKMNDPMEAFYETGGPSDWIIDKMLAPAGRKMSHIYSMLSEKINGFGLVSFASTHSDLPMWAYYASNFSGMCLEFDVAELATGDFQNEPLQQVVYARHALPPLTFADIRQIEKEMIARIARKRPEWSHEKEWRYLTGEVGPKYYLDDALRRVYLGPWIKPEYAEQVGALLARRPVEVLRGEIKGFELTFKSIRQQCPLKECEGIGARHFDPAEHLYAEKELREFLVVPFEMLVEECRPTALRPNMETFGGIDIAGGDKRMIYLCTMYRLRSGRTVYNKRYFDRRLRFLHH